MNPVNQSDIEAEAVWVRQASRGDLDACNRLVLCHQSMAYHYAAILVHEADLAEDITQESFIKAFTNIHRFRGGSFRAWLLKIVTNTAYDLLRQRKRHPAQSWPIESENGNAGEFHVELADPSASVEAVVEQNEWSKRLYGMLDELPDIFRSVMALVDLYDLDYSEASEILKVPKGTVKSRLARARMLMAKKLKNEPVIRLNSE